MDLTHVRRHIASRYYVYAVLLKVAYLLGVWLLARGFITTSIIVLGVTLFCDGLTDYFLVDTIKRSRLRMKGWRIIIFKKFGGLKAAESFLEELAEDFAARRGSLSHWQRYFALALAALERQGLKKRGSGQFFQYLTT